MRRFLATLAGLAAIMLVAAPAAASESADSAEAAAVAACKANSGAKKVTITVRVDGKTTTYRYTCSDILASSGQATVPAASDFKIGIDVLAKQCFASAGCSVAYRVNAKYDGATPLDPSKVYTVVYDVQGAESPITANFTIKGDKVSSHRGTAYIPNKNVNLQATATSVLEGDQG